MRCILPLLLKPLKYILFWSNVFVQCWRSSNERSPKVSFCLSLLIWLFCLIDKQVMYKDFGNINEIQTQTKYRGRTENTHTQRHTNMRKKQAAASGQLEHIWLFVVYEMKEFKPKKPQFCLNCCERWYFPECYTMIKQVTGNSSSSKKGSS